MTYLKNEVSLGALTYKEKKIPSIKSVQLINRILHLLVTGNITDNCTDHGLSISITNFNAYALKICNQVYIKKLFG